MIKKKELIADFQDVHKRLYGYSRSGVDQLSRHELQSGIMNMEERLDAIIKMSNFEDDWDWESERADRIFGL